MKHFLLTWQISATIRHYLTLVRKKHVPRIFDLEATFTLEERVLWGVLPARWYRGIFVFWVERDCSGKHIVGNFSAFRLVIYN